MADPAASLSREGFPGEFPDPASFRRALRAAIELRLPEFRIVAEGFLAEVTPIDLLAVGDDGALISIRIAGPGDDAAALTRALADLSWLRPRRADFRRLAPGLGIEPMAEPRVLLVAREFGRETRAAAGNLPPETVQLWRCWSDPAMGRTELRIESATLGLSETAPDRRPGADPASPPSTAGSASSKASAVPPPAEPAGPRPAAQRPERSAPLTAPLRTSAFRTGLVEADLDLAQGPEPGVRPGRRSNPATASGL